MRKHEILTRPTRPLTIDGRKNVAGLLEKMQGISFQGRNLATAYHVWKKMLSGKEPPSRAFFAPRWTRPRPYTPREFLHLLGKEILKRSKEDGIVTAAYKARVPLYCPAIGDSSIGIGIAKNRHLGKNRLMFDVVGDVLETARLAGESPASGVIYFGGGTPKNFIQQSEVTATFMRNAANGHKYALQVVTDAPHWGGLSGCTVAEAP